jgi:hypothetical protein
MASSVQAQSMGKMEKQEALADAKPYTMKLSVFAPSGTDARAQAGQALVGFEGTYTLQRMELGKQLTVFGLGYYERDGLRLMPLTITQIEKKDGGMYHGYGIGAYNTRPSIDLGDNRNKALFGVHYLVGKNLDADRFVEVKYNYVNEYNSSFSINGFQLGYGVRF